MKIVFEPDKISRELLIIKIVQTTYLCNESKKTLRNTMFLFCLLFNFIKHQCNHQGTKANPQSTPY